MQIVKYPAYVQCDGAPRGLANNEHFINPHHCQLSHKYKISYPGDLDDVTGYLTLCEKCATLAKLRGIKLKPFVKFVAKKVSMV